jgi:hypothetical protein
MSKRLCVVCGRRNGIENMKVVSAGSGRNRYVCGGWLDDCAEKYATTISGAAAQNKKETNLGALKIKSLGGWSLTVWFVIFLFIMSSFISLLENLMVGIGFADSQEVQQCKEDFASHTNDFADRIEFSEIQAAKEVRSRPTARTNLSGELITRSWYEIRCEITLKNGDRYHVRSNIDDDQSLFNVTRLE